MMLGLNDAVLTIAQVAVLVIVFVFSYEALKAFKMFGSFSCVILALCVAVISTIGIRRHVDALLIPYAALALTLLTVLLVGAFRPGSHAKQDAGVGDAKEPESVDQNWWPATDKERDSKREHRKLKRMD